MSILTITPEDGIWSTETQAKIRSTVLGDTVRLVGEFELNDQFQILGGARRLDLRQAKIKVKPPVGGTACFLFRNIPEDFRVYAGEIEYAHVEGSRPAGAVMYFIDCIRPTITGTQIKGVKGLHGIFMDARTVECNPRIQNCYVEFADGRYRTSHHNAIWLTSKLEFAPGTSETRASARAGVLPHPGVGTRIQNVRILENECHGGYYGIGGSGLVWGEVRGNKVVDNERGISLQDTCEDLQVHWNHVLGQRSAGIHLAYGTKNCVVEYNRVEGLANNNGEALMQAYVGTTGNTFRFNSVSTLGSPTHAFQGSLGGLLRIENCTARVAQVAKALVAAEQSWDSTLQQGWHSRANAPANEADGMEQAMANRVQVNDSVFATELREQVFSVASDVKGTANRVQLVVQDTQVSVPGHTLDLAVSASQPPQLEVEIPDLYGDESIPQYLSTRRNGRRFVSDAKILQERFGFVAPSGGGDTPTPPTPGPNPGTDDQPPTDLSGTLADGTKTKQLVAFITRPQGSASSQYGDWIAFMEVENGEVTTWPESVDIPQWSGKRGFPAVILPMNGAIQSEFKYLRRTYVELDGAPGYLGQHQGIKGVQWYARGAGMQIANENVTQVKTAAGYKPIQIAESPKTFPGTAGEAAPSGVATFVWVKGVGTNLTCQFVTVMGGKPVAHPDNPSTKASMTFTAPKGFPAIVWPGTRLPADQHFRNLSRSYITVPASESGKTGDFTVPASAIANSAKAKLVSEGGSADLQDSAVQEWFGTGAVVPDHGNGGGVAITSAQLKARMVNAMSQPNDIRYPGWGSNNGAAGPAQWRGGAVTMGSAFRVSRLNPNSELIRTGFDGGYTQEDIRRIGNDLCSTLQLWYCAVPGASGSATRVEMRNGAIYVLEEGSSVWKVLFRIRDFSDWCANQGPSMDPNNADRYNSDLGKDPADSPKGFSNGVAWIQMPTSVNRNAHGGHGDWSITGGQVVDKSINFDKAIGVMGVMEARLAPGYESREAALQVGFDPKWPRRPTRWFAGMAVSKLQRLSGEWQTFGVANLSNALDTGRGGIILPVNQFNATTIPGYN